MSLEECMLIRSRTCKKWTVAEEIGLLADDG